MEEATPAVALLGSTTALKLSAKIAKDFNLVHADELRTAFKKFDRNADGLLSVDELSGAIFSLGITGHSTETVEQLVRFIDTDQDGSVSIDEFCEALDPTRLQKLNALSAEIRASIGENGAAITFNAFDVNDDGHVSRPEFHSGLQSLRLPSYVFETADNLFDVADTNTDGLLSLQEFIAEVGVVEAPEGTGSDTLVGVVSDALHASVASLAAAIVPILEAEEDKDGTEALETLTSPVEGRADTTTPAPADDAAATTITGDDSPHSPAARAASREMFNGMAADKKAVLKSTRSTAEMTNFCTAVLKAACSQRRLRFGMTKGWQCFIDQGGKKFAKQMDEDSDGQISFEGFHTFTVAHPDLFHNLQHLHDMFKELDTDGNGKLTKDEVESLVNKEVTLHNAKRSAIMTKTIARSLMKVADWNKDKAVSFDEFVTVLTEKPSLLSCQEGLKAIFRMHDRDGDGNLTREELEVAIAALPGAGAGYEVPLVDLVMASMDKNNDGRVTFQEFCEFCTSEMAAPSSDGLRGDALPASLAWILVCLKEYSFKGAFANSDASCAWCQAPLLPKEGMRQLGFNLCSASCRDRMMDTPDWALAKNSSDKMELQFGAGK